jgi:acetyltransferase-like isoleucine patch superfamily enzyme
MIKILKLLLSLYNKLLITSGGLNSDLFFRLDKRHKDSMIYVGKDCLLNGRLVTVTKQSKIIIKDNVFIGAKTIIDCKDEVVIEDNVLISYECIIVDHNSHSLDANKREDDLLKFKNDEKDWQEVNSKKITIKKNAWICTRSIILKGVTIGEGAIVAAGSVVTNNVEDYTLVAGNPAVFKKKIT